MTTLPPKSKQGSKMKMMLAAPSQFVTPRIRLNGLRHQEAKRLTTAADQTSCSFATNAMEKRRMNA